MMITEAKITEFFCAIDVFNKNFDKGMSKHALISSSGKPRRHRQSVLSESEIMTRYANKVFKGFATDGKGTMGWCHGFKVHFTCNDTEGIISFCLTGANVDDRSDIVWNVLAKDLYGKLLAGRG